MLIVKYVLFTENFQRLIHTSIFDTCFSQLVVFIFFTICLVGPDFGSVSLEILASPHSQGIRQSANCNILLRLYFTELCKPIAGLEPLRLKLGSFKKQCILKITVISSVLKFPYKMFSPNQTAEVLRPQCVFLPLH